MAQEILGSVKINCDRKAERKWLKLFLPFAREWLESATNGGAKITRTSFRTWLIEYPQKSFP